MLLYFRAGAGEMRALNATKRPTTSSHWKGRKQQRAQTAGKELLQRRVPFTDESGQSASHWWPSDSSDTPPASAHQQHFGRFWADNQQITICLTLAFSISRGNNQHPIRLTAVTNYPFRIHGQVRVESTRLIWFPYQPAISRPLLMTNLITLLVAPHSKCGSFSEQDSTIKSLCG